MKWSISPTFRSEYIFGVQRVNLMNYIVILLVTRSLRGYSWSDVGPAFAQCVTNIVDVGHALGQRWAVNGVPGQAIKPWLGISGRGIHARACWRTFVWSHSARITLAGHSRSGQRTLAGHYSVAGNCSKTSHGSDSPNQRGLRALPGNDSRI